MRGRQKVSNKVMQFGVKCCHLSVILVVESEGHAGGHQQEQRLLLTQFLPEAVDDFRTLVGSLSYTAGDNLL